MYAVVETGGKQYKVSEGEIFNVEKLNSNIGDIVNLKVLMVVTDAGVKFEGEVKAEVINHGKEDKVRVLKYKAKKHSKKQQGHRQPFTTLKVTTIA